MRAGALRAGLRAACEHRLNPGRAAARWRRPRRPPLSAVSRLLRGRELAGERDPLLLVGGADLGAVDLAGNSGQALEDHAAHDLAVLEQAGDAVGPDLQHRPGAWDVAAAVAEAGIEEAGVVDAELAEVGVVADHLAGVGHPTAH